jgi:anti-sigma regulatory factor (Ser/Thr protein kinase)
MKEQRAIYQCASESGPQARTLIRNYALRHLDRAAADDLEVAAGEALANTIEHSGATAFCVRCCCDVHGVIVEIHDNGGGFRHQLHLKYVERTVTTARGFGLVLIHRLIDEVSFADDGRLIRLQKYWSAQRLNARTG